MYETHHRFEDLEEGRDVLWNGRERTVARLNDTHARIDGNWISERDINRMFRDECIPFELVDEPKVES